MTVPRLEIELKKIGHNVKELRNLFGYKGISVTAVTKAVLGSPEIANILVEGGINSIGDSRIANISKMRKAGIEAQFILIRIPMVNETENVVRYADISLNSEISVMKQLSKYAVEQGKNHKVVLMVEMGDLREGIMPSDLEKTVEETICLESISLVGIGTNLACYGGIKPTEEKMQRLSSIANDIQNRYGIKLEIVSGGNSANYEWFMTTDDIGLINNLRIGEAILLGCETLHRREIHNLYTDAFTLIGEVIELKIKPSLPYGEVCQDAFGNVPKFENKGYIKRAIVGLGRQDVDTTGIKPRMEVEVLGSSSDHLILNIKDSDLKVGDEIGFDVNYSALVRAMTSPYVKKMYL
ncbi:MAG: alanine/ornithine racemase family PLP-dependent enzyme [Candidatus Marinimicrobia bacterium]|nr:alanine/ornithine racemase family PLP-dependent enzyme [Candidatus Neomarinimicrobiota bacterium]